jgi:hypothetical protein
VHLALRPFDCAQGKLAEWVRMTEIIGHARQCVSGIYL